MSLQFRNTLGGKLEPFEPLEPGRVRMYSCGPTVYAPAHVGNFRAFVFADLLHRTLLFLSLIHISEPTRRRDSSRMPSSA